MEPPRRSSGIGRPLADRWGHTGQPPADTCATTNSGLDPACFAVALVAISGPPSRFTPGENRGISQQTDRELEPQVPKPAVFRHGPRPLPRASSIAIDASMTPLHLPSDSAVNAKSGPTVPPTGVESVARVATSSHASALLLDHCGSGDAKRCPRRVGDKTLIRRGRRSRVGRQQRAIGGARFRKERR